MSRDPARLFGLTLAAVLAVGSLAFVAFLLIITARGAS